jgi:hypothetical protein
VSKWIAPAICAAAAVLALGLSVSPSSPASASASCGKERWSVKTLQDPAGTKVDLGTVKKTTVNKLRALPVQRGPGGLRGQGAESTVYQVRARLIDTREVEDDDFHLVIAGITTPGTMIVEFPLVPSCTSKATKTAKELDEVLDVVLVRVAKDGDVDPLRA